MDGNRAMMKVRLGEYEGEQKKLRGRARNICRQITPLINPDLSEIEAMNIASAADNMDELVMIQAELLSLQSKISDLENSLYG